jgi:OmpA-OmpF porin, OOP family
MNRKTIILSLMAVLFVSSIFAFGASGGKAKVKGIINNRTGSTLIVSTRGGEVTVVLTDDTKTRDKKGIFGLDKVIMSNAVLIPGLKVSVNGTYDDQGRVVARTITTDGDDLETSEMIQAGLHPTAEQVAINVKNIERHDQNLAAHQETLMAHEKHIKKNMKDIEAHTNRFNALSDFNVKAEATVKFKVGSAKISDEDQEALKALAQTAIGLTGYIIEVQGYTDSTGTPVMNTKLSENRAKAVIIFMMQQGNVPVRHFVAPGAMGEYGAVASNETSEGRAENRRVSVKVLVNKGIAGE